METIEGTYTCDGNLRSMRQDELDLIELGPAAPVLDGICPPVAGVAKAVYEDDGGRVLLGRREKQWGQPPESAHGGREGVGFRESGEVEQLLGAYQRQQHQCKKQDETKTESGLVRQCDHTRRRLGPKLVVDGEH